VSGEPATLAEADPRGARPRPASQHVVISSFDNRGNPHYNGGGAVMVEMLARSLASHFHVTVVTAGQRRRMEIRDGVRYLELPLGWAGPRGGQLLFHMLLPFAARRIRHDLWIESFTPPFSTSFLPLFSPTRVVGLASTLSGEEMWRRYRLPFFLVERFGLRFYRDVVVLNSADSVMVRRFSPSATIRVIPNGIDLPPADCGLVGRGSHILFLGRIDLPHKGLDLLLAAYEQAHLSMPLVIAGKGTRRDERKFAAMARATGADVRWVGHVAGQRKRQLLEECAFLVMPSRYESFGLVALEAMSYGKPVVHFDLPYLCWIKGDVRVPPFDVSAMAEAMRTLAADETVRRELGRTAQAAAQRFSQDQTADRYLALVRELLNECGAEAVAERDQACP
jgi:glycosyltransferase involved in cell wall biosynthesis